ncbi:MAG: hypothetical protein LUE93_16030 [Bacteroides sp.]|nr:hypothetical protein [Bacteroides sp.]
MRKIIYLTALFLLPLVVSAQLPNREQVIQTMCKVADHITRNTTYLYYDKNTGEQIADLTKHGYKKGLFPRPTITTGSTGSE